MRISTPTILARRAASAAFAVVLLVLGVATPVHPAAAGLDWSQSGQRLAFWCDSGLYSVNIAQGWVVRLASRAVAGVCSPDGIQVAWSDDDGTYVGRSDIAGGIRVAEAGRIAGWSPDSRWVLVESSPPGHAPELYAARADGKGLAPLAPNPAWDGDAACSPDGRWVAFVSGRDSARSDIWVVGWDGSHLTRVTSMFEAGEPAWSPDGATLAFSGRESGSSHRRIYCLGFRTRKLTCVTAGTEADYRAPRFVGPTYLLYRGAGCEVANLSTGARRALPQGELAPDGRRVAALSGCPGSLDVTALKDGSRSSVDKGVEAFAWSPDGRRLAYLALTNGPGGQPVRELCINTLDPKGIYILWSEGLRSPGPS
jgi:Tol biopolymer transport system component